MNILISFLQAFAIILVVIGHAGSWDMTPFLYKWIYSFHMPLFVFISGFLLKETNFKIDQINLFVFLKKKAIRLLVPYITISSFAYIPKIILNNFAMRPVNFSLKNFIDGLIFPGLNPIIFFWFLPTIFIILCFFVVFFKINTYFKTNFFLYSCFICIIFLHFINFKKLSFLNIGGVFYFSIFFALGILYNNYQKIIDKIFKLNNTVILISLFLILSSNLFFNFVNITYLSFFYQIIGILFSLSLGKFYIKYNFKFLDNLYGKTFSIYLFSWFPQVFIRIVLTQIFNFNLIITLVLSTFFGIYIPILIFYTGKLSFFRNKKSLKIILGL